MSDPLDDAQSPTGALNPAANPFRSGPGEVPPRFGGREQELIAARVMLEQLLALQYPTPRVLEGLRGVGKTALMVRIRQAAVARGIRTAAIEVHRTSPVEGLRSELTAFLDEITPRSQLKRLAGRLSTASIGPGGVEIALTDTPGAPLQIDRVVRDIAIVARATERPVLLTIDEAHEAGPGLAGVIRGLHAAAQDRAPVGAYLAGLPGTRDQLAKEVTYAERLPAVSLGLLDRDAVREAIAGPFEDHDVAVDEAVSDVVADHSGGYPFFVQVWGRRLWVTTEDSRHVGVEAVERARASVDAELDSFLSARWERLTAGQRNYVRAMAEVGLEGVASAAIARRLAVAPNDVSYLRRELIVRGLVHAPHRGQLAFSVPRFAEWVRRAAE